VQSETPVLLFELAEFGGEDKAYEKHELSPE